jgi:pseudouridine synthase
MRLNRFLAQAGIASRRKCEAIIEAGRVRVGGEVVTPPARVVDTSKETVECDGVVVRVDAGRRYLALHKPTGVLTSIGDPHGRATVADFIPDDAGRLYPAGRLDGDTTGLVLLLDDGKLAFRVTHPRYKLPKQYLALVRGVVRHRTLRRLTEGVELEDGPARALAAHRVLTDGSHSVLRITLGEGRKRQVRRMCTAVGHRVVLLHRDAIGPLLLGDLDEGRVRELSPFEVRALRRAVELGDT